VTIRRIFEMTCVTAGLLFLSPVFLIIALAIKLGDDGPVFHRQARVGRNFQEFHLLKFRSMVPNADSAGFLTVRDDPRITKVGALLRKCKLDELPQLLNVLNGGMQIVGPRPEVRRYVELFRSQYALLLHDRPGITDPASILFRSEANGLDAEGFENQYLSRILPQKLAISLAYQRTRTFRSDLAVVMRTVLGLSAKASDVVSVNESQQPSDTSSSI
jgi:lipopolysaccharide/colanic/teichoic acid biosynthesis glycosyltransferase